MILCRLENILIPIASNPTGKLNKYGRQHVMHCLLVILYSVILFLIWISAFLNQGWNPCLAVEAGNLNHWAKGSAQSHFDKVKAPFVLVLA